MKYNQIILFYPSFEKGGVEKILINLVLFLLKKKLKIILISSKINIDIKNKNFQQKVLKKRNSRFYSAIKAGFTLSKILKSLKKNNELKNTFVLSLQSNSIAIIISKIFRTKIIIRNSENILGGITSKDENLIKSGIILFQKLILYNFCDYIITNSIGSQEIMKKFLFNNKIKCIYNPYLKKINNKKISKKKNNILFVGRFVKQKGIIYLLQAFNILVKKNYNFKLLLIGDGPDQKKILNFIRLNKLKKRVKIVGWTNKLSKYYLESKIFVLPSVYEGLGNVVIESLNYFLPTIVSNCKFGPSEIVLNGKGGYIFENKNKDDLLNKIIKIIDNYNIANKKTLIGHKSLKRFLIKQQCEKYFAIFNKL